MVLVYFRCVFGVCLVKKCCFARSAKKIVLVFGFWFFCFSVFQFFGFSVFRVSRVGDWSKRGGPTIMDGGTPDERVGD